MARFARIASQIRADQVIRANRLIRAACLQNETAPEKLLNGCEKGLKNAKKDPKSDPKCDRKILLPLSGRLKIFHRHVSTNFKSFSPPKISTKESFFFFFSLRGSAGVATLRP